MSFLDALRRWARQLKRDVLALWFARRHPQTPWHAKALGAFVVAYALSPIDLIPDFIPVLGFLDDVILLPGLIWLTLRLLPPQALADSRDKAQAWMDARRDRPHSRVGAVVIVLLWVGVVAALAVWAWPWVRNRMG
ncbi:YkvA family protein [Pseudacidovorax intermedius]|uniref:YkvA family protein n=1 Tax=Pseudacidovorax intermedius TaxID=433924 RepID=UPI0005B8149A|nr:YkvA family protein [Pseudacidovorax intermedius]